MLLPMGVSVAPLLKEYTLKEEMLLVRSPGENKRIKPKNRKLKKPLYLWVGELSV